MGHIEAAILLMPYHEIIEDIANDVEKYKSFSEVNYEEMIAYNPESIKMTKEKYSLIQQFVELVTTDPIMARAYIKMMDTMNGQVS